MNKFFILLMISAFTFSGVRAQSATDIRKKQFNISAAGLALAGYDPVSYFTQKKAIEGRKDLTVANNGLVYRFTTEHNKELFKADPAKYEPQYGGWCAFAMGDNGEKVSVDPGTFKLVNGKLYLFYNKFFNNTKKAWDKNEAALKGKADANWSKILQN